MTKKKRKKSDWYIKKEVYDHGGLYELITTTTYFVFHKCCDEPVYVFKGEVEADLDNNGSWEVTGLSGVSDIILFEDEGYLLVKYYGRKKDKKFPLKIPPKEK